MPKGVIKFYSESRGYGFIESNGEMPEPGVYVHYSQISDDDHRTLREGEEVTFDVKESQRGLEAVNVQKLP